MSELKLPFSLTEQERRSDVWKKLHRHLCEQLEAARLSLEADAPETQAYRLRGRIQTLRALIALNEPPRNLMEVPPEYKF